MSKTLKLDTATTDVSASAGVAPDDGTNGDDSPDGITDSKNRRVDQKLSARGAAAMLQTAMPNGDFEISNESQLKLALKEFDQNIISKYSRGEIMAHIIRRAKSLALVRLLPPEWGITMEMFLDTGVADLALPAITTKTHLRKAIRTYTGGKRRKAHIIKRANALGASSMLPDSWTTAEEINSPIIIEEVKLPETFQSILVLEGEVPQAVILEAVEGQAAGSLRIKMPFYVGESVTRPPGFAKKVYFPSSLISETVAEGKKQILAGKQPLTVYARHSHALSNDHLPIGGIVGLEQEGRIGYVILEIEPTTFGKDAQILLMAKPPKLNAISLRSGPNRFELEDVRVNGEEMFRPTKLWLDGVDFAPDSPAMATYGFEILTAEATVTSEEIIKKKEVSQQVDEITLEAVRAKPEIVEEIEKPLLQRLGDEMTKNKTLVAENVALKDQAAKNDLNVYAEEMASKHPQKDEAKKIFLELAATCKTKEEFAAKLLPHFVNATAAIKTTVVAETLESKIKSLFPATNSIALVEEAETEEELLGEHVGPLEVPS